MPTVRLTHRGIASYKAGRWLTDYWDDRLTGFGVRVTHRGTKVYVVRYTHNGCKRRVTLGRYPALKCRFRRSRPPIPLEGGHLSGRSDDRGSVLMKVAAMGR